MFNWNVICGEKITHLLVEKFNLIGLTEKFLMKMFSSVHINTGSTQKRYNKYLNVRISAKHERSNFSTWLKLLKSSYYDSIKVTFVNSKQIRKCISGWNIPADAYQEHHLAEVAFRKSIQAL